VGQAAGGERGAHHAERRAVANGGEAARVAVREHLAPWRHQARAVRAHGAAGGFVSGRDPIGRREQPGGQLVGVAAAIRVGQGELAIQRPAQVHGRRARRPEESRVVPQGRALLG